MANEDLVYRLEGPEGDYLFKSLYQDYPLRWPQPTRDLIYHMSYLLREFKLPAIEDRSEE